MELKSYSKRSQITVFVILALIIVVAVMLFLVLRNPNSEAEKISPEVYPIYTFTNDCVLQTSQNAIYHIGDTGGYFFPPNQSLNNYVAYYFMEKDSFVPSINQIENEISSYINNMLFYCTKNYVDFPGYDVKQGEIKTTTKIINDSIFINVNYPIRITKDNKNYYFNKFNTKEDIRFNTIYDVSKQIISLKIKNPGEICVSCIGDLAIEKNLVINLIDHDDDTKIYAITDFNSKLNNEPYTFNFAVKSGKRSMSV